MDAYVRETLLVALDWYEDDCYECRKVEDPDNEDVGYGDIFAAIQTAREWVNGLPVGVARGDWQET